MAKISLRAYNREIETLIEHGNHDQAIAHCRHILSIYNKYIFTYRLLGKAYLESQRFGDAGDIFQRVLSTLPDDFISHVGMSIIREDEGTLDEAIWHMERAYEVQPANNAIQRELQRLYGKRDGIEPPKIRLTRAALARMYIKGELYEQAINELRPTQEPVSHRPDIYILLAQVYYLTGKRIDAAQVCNQLIKRLPFCFEANRILIAILTETDRANEARSYRQRLISLDPYAAHTSSTSPTPDQVPDSAVTLEKLEWNPDTSPSDMLSKPEWAASLGVEIEEDRTDQESLPEWLDTIDEQPVESGGEDEDLFEPISEHEDTLELDPITEETLDISSEEKSIPPWMKDAGWEAASEPTEETEFLSADDEQDDSLDELAPAELPDWVHDIAPSDEAIESDDTPHGDTSQSEDESLPVETNALPWLEETPPGPTDTVASWLEDKEPQLPEDAELDLDTGEPLEIPEWLQDLKQDDIPPVPAGHKPDQELEDSLKDDEEKHVEEKEQDSAHDLPVGELSMGVAAGIVAAARDEDDGHDQDLGEPIQEVQGEVSFEEEIPEEQLETSALPQTGQYETDDVEAEIDEFEEPSEEISEEMDTAVLEITRQQEELDETLDVEAILSSDADIDAELPHTIQDESLDLQFPPEMDGLAAEVDDEGLQEAQEEIAISSQEEDEAFAWLEGLAAKQGVDEALLLESEDHIAKPPEWVKAEADEVGGELEAESDQAELDKMLDERALPVSEEQTEELPEWLKGIQPGDQIVEEPYPDESSEIPDWLKQAELTTEEHTEMDMEPSETEHEEAIAEEIPDWLKGSAAIAGVGVMASTKDEDASSEFDENIQSGDVQEWLSESGEGQPIIGDERQEEIDQELVADEGISFEQTATGEVVDEHIHEVGTDESPDQEFEISDEDTKPIRISPVDEVPIPPAPSETKPVPVFESTEDDGISHESLEEDLPDWIQDLSEELELSTDTIESVDEKVPSMQDDEDWVTEQLSGEVSLEEDEDLLPVTSVSAEDASRAEQEVESAEILDDEDAFAWLEGLAAKHGAEEAMLLEPDDRQETPPEWVLAEGEAQETLEAPAQEDELDTEFEVYDIERSETPESIEQEQVVEEELAETVLAEGIQETVHDLDEVIDEEEVGETVTESETETLVVETAVTESSTDEATPGEETVPELPPWLAGIEEESAVAETPEWISTPEVSQDKEDIKVEHELEETPELVDLNQAGLVELEHLPGVGFIKAQAIIEYRESIGHFTSIDELQNISGIGPVLIEEIEDLVIIDIPDEDISEMPTDEHQLALIQARNALIEGDITTSLEHYDKLIQSRQIMSDVIQDLNEALYRFPVDIGIWQALGDALMRSGHIQEALDAYTKAEELLR